MIILNEKEYAEDCINNGLIDKKPFLTLSILAKYYYHCFGYRKKKIVSLLTEFMESNYIHYSTRRAYWEDSIEKIAANAGKYTLYEITGVWITKAELETIEKIKSKALERLAFTYLCLAKLSMMKNPHNNGWVNNDDKDIFNMARIACGIWERDNKIVKLHDLGLLEYAKRIDNLSCRVTFVDDDSEKVLYVTDFRELGYEYLKYKGENFIRCAECGILARGNKNGTKKYCSNCSNTSPIETKEVICVDCGRGFTIKSKNNRTSRCPICQRNYRNNYQKEIMRKTRHNVVSTTNKD